MKRLCLGTGLLARGSVQDQDGLIGLDHLRQGLDLLDEPLLQRVASAGVNYDDILV